MWESLEKPVSEKTTYQDLASIMKPPFIDLWFLLL
jgi:hypothetical protein